MLDLARDVASWALFILGAIGVVTGAIGEPHAVLLRAIAPWVSHYKLPGYRASKARGSLSQRTSASARMACTRSHSCLLMIG